MAIRKNTSVFVNHYNIYDLTKIIPKKVTLISCPWIFHDEVEFQSQNLGLGYIGAYAEQFNHKIIKFIDPMIDSGHKIKLPIKTKYQMTNRFGFSDDWIVNQIPGETDVIGINAPFTDSRIVLYPLTKKIKSRFPKVPLIIGGVLATTLPEQVIEESGADVVVKGEGEIPFVKILNGEHCDEIPGLVFKNSKGDIIKNTLRGEQLKSITEIPSPGYNFRPMDEYVKWSPRGDKADRTLSMISSRGCPFNCNFCSITEKSQRWRPFGSKRIINEIKTAIDKWGVNHIEFEDDNFILRESRALEILGYIRDLRQKGYPISCSFPNGIMISKMSKEIAVQMVKAGVDIVYLPVESGDKRILISMNKPNAKNHLEKTLEVAKWCADAGLFVSCFIIVGYPGGRISLKKNINLENKKYLFFDGNETYISGEDEESYQKTLNFCKKLLKIGVKGITPLLATPYPGTELYNFCKKFKFLSYPDEKDVLTTISYANVQPDYVQIDTPWCSKQRMFERWREMFDMFPSYHNVRKEVPRSGYLSGKEMKERLQ
jgi:anaerobic magnesium-protoporphyrin IX monomethyl ester cyclase